MKYLWNKRSDELLQELKNPDNYLVAGRDGLYDVRVGEIGTFIAYAREPVLHLEKMQEGFVFNLPRVPFSVLQPGLVLFYAFCEKRLEARYQIFWNRDSKSYFGHIPRFTSTSVRIFTERSWELEQKHLLVVDLHSHLSSKALFSSVDDENELESEIFYCVVATGGYMPDVAMRYSCGGNYVSVEPGRILEMPFSGAALL